MTDKTQIGAGGLWSGPASTAGDTPHSELKTAGFWLVEEGWEITQSTDVPGAADGIYDALGIIASALLAMSPADRAAAYRAYQASQVARGRDITMAHHRVIAHVNTFIDSFVGATAPARSMFKRRKEVAAPHEDEANAALVASNFKSILRADAIEKPTGK